MRLKLDENLPLDLAHFLSDRGHDVETVLGERLGGEDDPLVVRAATDEERLVFTLDRGVGDIRRYPPGSHPGIVVLRPASQDAGSLLELVDRFLQWAQLSQLNGCVLIVEPHRVRVRRADSGHVT